VGPVDPLGHEREVDDRAEVGEVDPARTAGSRCLDSHHTLRCPPQLLLEHTQGKALRLGELASPQKPEREKTRWFRAPTIVPIDDRPCSYADEGSSPCRRVRRVDKSRDELAARWQRSDYRLATAHVLPRHGEGPLKV